jgi:hypothetical protein
MTNDEMAVIEELEDLIGKKMEKTDYIFKYTYGYQEEDGRIIKLALYGRRLTSLPKSIGNLVNLKSLNLNFNDLQSLPESIANMVNLEELEIFDNRLLDFPEVICRLTNLKKLSIIGNKFSSVPQDISNLTHLEYLNLSENKLTTLPDAIGNLECLSTLRLSYNKLTSLPESLIDLKLKHLVIEGNKSLESSSSAKILIKSLKKKGVKINKIPKFYYD